MRKMMRYCKIFGGKDPEMIEGDVFRIVVKVPEFKSSSNQEKRPRYYSDRTKFRNQVLRPLLDAGFVEMAIPDKPTSSKQKYRITEKGASVSGKEE